MSFCSCLGGDAKKQKEANDMKECVSMGSKPAEVDPNPSPDVPQPEEEAAPGEPSDPPKAAEETPTEQKATTEGEEAKEGEAKEDEAKEKAKE